MIGPIFPYFNNTSGLAVAASATTTSGKAMTCSVRPGESFGGIFGAPH